MDLFELRYRVKTLPEYEEKMVILRARVRNAESDVDSLKFKYEQEKRDFERLEEGGLAGFFLKATGRFDKRLDKLEQAKASTKLSYSQTSEHLARLKAEKSQLAEKISRLQLEKKAYQETLEERRKRLKEDVNFIQIQEARGLVAAQIVDMERALRLANNVKSTAQKTYDSLKSAKGWATYDVFFRTGLFTHLAKYSHIDDAKENSRILSSQVRDLSDALEGLRGHVPAPTFAAISSCQRAVDFWLSNIFTSLSVRGKVVDNIDEVRSLKTNLDNVKNALNNKLKEKRKLYELSKKDEENLLLSL